MLAHEFFPAKGRAPIVLDFDIENRPLSYWYPDRPTAEVTAIAWAFTDRPKDIHVRLLGYDSLEGMLSDFVSAYNEADMVTGHYIRKHDLPILNGALIEVGLPPLGQKMAHDTKLDLVTMGDLPASQEELSLRLGVPANKFHMTQHAWRQANRLTEEGLELTRKRVMGDVKQHMALRKRLLELGLLAAPSVWTP